MKIWIKIKLALAITMLLPSISPLACRAVAQEPVPRPAAPPKDEEVREAAFLYLFNIVAGPGPDSSVYCLSINSAVSSYGGDPTEALLSRLSKTRRTVQKLSECQVNKQAKDLFGAVKNKKTGKRAWMVSLGPLVWVSDHEVRLGGSNYCGGLCSWSSTLQATLRDGKWTAALAPDAVVFVSESQPNQFGNLFSTSRSRSALLR